jgi:predicted MFS family arabinose efflux permease
MSLVALGFISWVNVSYILKANNEFPDYYIATSYLIAMLADGLLVLPIGLMYDKFGLVSLLFVPIFSILIIPFLLTQNFISVAIASIFWGIVMAIYESNARAAIADILPENKIAFVYGVFGLGFGAAWMIGSAIYGYLYEISQSSMIYFTLTTEILALILLLLLLNHSKIKDKLPIQFFSNLYF